MAVKKKLLKKYRHYTNVVSLIKLLTDKKLLLSDPNYWDDRNDRAAMNEYKKRNEFSCVLAVCLSKTGETYHHWSVFSKGIAGVCVEFDARELDSDISRCSVPTGTKLFGRDVKYYPISVLKRLRLESDQLGFAKRISYKDEKEFRVMYTSTNHAHRSDKIFECPIRIVSVSQILLSPWMYDTQIPSTKKAINSIDGCAGIKIAKSTLVQNDTWIRELTK
ncbi:MAG TPA: hypothetical protein DCL54_11020 [Alphaproteobacteria bacterium]|nr:hypothetical protein [Alphaproteobacteria bacterium]HAJ47100.1 hypothetical protein [Alphaproteobacteria bacterium]